MMEEAINKFVTAIVAFFNELSKSKLIGDERQHFIINQIKDLLDKCDILGKYEPVLLPLITSLLEGILLLKEECGPCIKSTCKSCDIV